MIFSTSEVESTLALVNPQSLSADEDLRYRLIQAEMKLSDNQPDAALSLLGSPPAQDSLRDLQQRYYHYKAEAYLQKQDIVNRALAADPVGAVNGVLPAASADST